MKYNQFTSKTELALNDPLWLICRKTKKKIIHASTNLPDPLLLHVSIAHCF